MTTKIAKSIGFSSVKDMRTAPAFSIRQPYAEDILRGGKPVEYRPRPTHKRQRVLIYAGLRPGDPDYYQKLGLEPGDLPVGMIIGSVEIVDCVKGRRHDDFEWKLGRPKRLARPIAPKQHPQPSWFYPFGRA